MSEPNVVRPAHERRDLGMSIPEVLVSVLVMGLLATVLSGSLVVLFKQRPATEGRLNVARAEQQVGAWVPADLASAETVDTSPNASPCGTACPANVHLTGSNAMLLTWQLTNADGSVTTKKVSYHFSLADDGVTYDLTRIACQSAGGGWSCSSVPVLHDLPGPPGGATFQPGVTSPSWVILVSEPLAADATNDQQLADTSQLKNAKRVVVTINGGGTNPGAGGGINQISITAGGTTRTVIDANSVQGAPSFTEARSRCGGPIALIIDESNSIGASITQVKAGVTAFVTALAGTPVQLQLVGFHSYSHLVGDASNWHHYFNMTNDADVQALLTDIDNLKGSWTGTGNGSTNWEEALYRTFFNADGTTAATIPDTVVFFTDGVPTMDRLVRRTAPGILPAQPAAVSMPPWKASSGSSYSQVGFDRANYYATLFRSSVKFIGVGVGADINSRSTWISDPGAGYKYVWERGSWTYQSGTSTYQARYQVRATSSSPWVWATKAQYNAASGSRRQDKGWTTITKAEYLAGEVPPNNNNSTSNSGNDGFVVTTTWNPISTDDYNRLNTTADESDGYRANPSGKQYTSPYLDWETWTGSRPDPQAQYRSTKVYNVPPYDGYDPAVTASTVNSVILARLIAGNDNGVPAIWDGSQYTNVEEADMYVLPQWSQFTSALQAVALGKCGGTLTIQTKLNGATPVADPFTYQNSAVKDSAGQAVAIEPTVVRTNQQFTTGTFDFSIPNGTYVDVDVVPQNLSDLTGYAPNGWSCRAGVANRTVTGVPITDSPWSGIRVRVAANEAVSCILSVRKV